MRKITVIGLFCTGKDVADGQSVKTRIVTEELEKTLGTENVVRIDTFGWKKNPFKLFVNCILAVRQSKNVMFLTDEGGIKVFPWLLQWANWDNRCKIHYYVVGGWLNKYLNKSKAAEKHLKKLGAIYVEVPQMMNELLDKEFDNVVLVNKFRRLTIVDENGINCMKTPTYKLCYFSRVMYEKGIEDAIQAVKLANKNAGFLKYSLDVMGTINPEYEGKFESLLKEYPEFLNYQGVVDFKKSTQVLKDYFAMLFPTFYESEGYPNAFVDAFAAGLPIITTYWHYNHEIINNYEDGILTDVNNVNQITSAIEWMSDHPKEYRKMRKNCVNRCKEYLPENAVAKVIEELN